MRIFIRDRMPRDHYIRIGAINTRYWAEGNSGSSVILIHGLGASAEIWIDNVSALAMGHRVYVPDLVGFGLTDKPDVVYSSSYMTGFLYDFIEALNIDNPSLVGMSLGGGLALQFTLQFPDKVQKLVLADSAGLSRDMTLFMRLATLPFLGELMVRPNRAGTALVLRRCVHDPAVIPGDLVELYYRFSTLPGARRAILSVLRTNSSFFGCRPEVINPIIRNLGTIKVPTLVIWGMQDRILPVSHAYIARDSIPDARLQVFDACGHMPNFERPAEFNASVLNFLNECPSCIRPQDGI